MMDKRSGSMSRRQVLRIRAVACISLALGGSLTAGLRLNGYPRMT